ncbi:MAG: hypothetical protein DRO88_04120 [Promethearchaeia archaeon]|nr:MAG: hypothetical protein DRO88_04120 [Candidatus Lokiarchaeia archaeon]
MNTDQIILHIQEDPDVNKIYRIDPESQFYFQEITAEDLEFLRKIYPNFTVFSKTPMWCITGISSHISTPSKAYAKIKIYLNRDGEMVSKFKNF